MSEQLRPYVKAGRVLRLLAGIQVVFFVAIVAAIIGPMFAQHTTPSPTVYLALLFLLIPGFYLSVGKAIMEHKEWGRTVGIILGCLMLPGFPLGTLIGGYVLWCLIQGWDRQPAQQVMPAVPTAPIQHPERRGQGSPFITCIRS